MRQPARLAWSVLVACAFVSGAYVMVASAQQPLRRLPPRAMPEASQAPVPMPRPQAVTRNPMSPEEKVAFAKKVDVRISGVLDTLTLTARQPYVENQGYLTVTDGGLNPGNGDIKLLGRDSRNSDLHIWWTTPDPTARYLVDFEIRPQGYASKKWEVWVDGSKSLVEPPTNARHLTVIAEGLGANYHAVTLRPATNGDNWVLAVDITRLK